MKTTIEQIFREIQTPEIVGRLATTFVTSMSEARRRVHVGGTHGVQFNGSSVHSMTEEVEVTNDSVLQVGKITFHREGGEWIQLAQLKTGVRYLMQLVDSMNEKSAPLCLKAQPSPSDNMLMLGVEGYGEMTAMEGCGFPIVIEQYEGKLRLLVWGDINKEDPTHVISLEGAREDAREGD